MTEADLYQISDGGTLRTLDGGLEIIRREKHEWKPSLDRMAPQKLAKRTGKIWGSKFYSAWTLPVLVNWIESVVAAEGWQLHPGHASDTERLLDREIGLVAGVSSVESKS
ncbi:MAG TPA: hypothetical protein VHY37_11345 [Tepidisphaeraceae bacterium]|nr:hypothetical protein [Tepidisphaeraceae bacterium]